MRNKNIEDQSLGGCNQRNSLTNFEKDSMFAYSKSRDKSIEEPPYIFSEEEKNLKNWKEANDHKFLNI